MDQAITIGVVVFVYGSLAALGAILVIGFLLWLLSVFASGFNH